MSDKVSSYNKVRSECNKFNNKLRKRNIDMIGKYIFDKEPIKLGGNPIDMSNKYFISQEEHIKLVNWWNNKIIEFRKEMGNNNG